MRLSAVSVAAALVVAILAAGAGTAAAYPQFQFSTDNERCGNCHLAPMGGGLLNDYGRSEAADTISGRGDGAFLHGAWAPPGWLLLGADLRGVLGAKQLDGQDPELLAFPMQADLYAQVNAGPLRLAVTAGLRGAARERSPGPTPTQWLASREHYLMYQKDDDAPYVRLGRFYPVFGIRTQDHTAYPRRHLGFYLLEEPYALGGGVVRATWEAHASAFVGNPVPFTGAGPRASGAAAYYEKRLAGNTRALAGQARFATTDVDRRYTVGAVGKQWLPGPRLMLLGELDLQLQSFTAEGGGADARLQMVGHASVTRMMLPGWMIGAAFQRWAPDLTLRGSTRNALEVNAQAFPWAHVELHLLLRAEATGGDTFEPNLLSLLQLHYYL
ncbi:MAG: hypothetical protein K8M05_17920 [Deltaproteobacteria bacterium]|nr:hypothetical protein [Kofleriaceae bacterium]